MHTLHASGIAYCCLKLGRPDEAVEWFWRDFDYLCRNAENYKCFAPLFDHPRYRELAEKLESMA